MKKRPTPFEKPSALEPRQHHTTDLFPGLLRVFVAEVRAALPWLTLVVAIGAVIEAAAAVWRAM